MIIYPTKKEINIECIAEEERLVEAFLGRGMHVEVDGMVKSYEDGIKFAIKLIKKLNNPNTKWKLK
jgi:hypothetical protein